MKVHFEDQKAVEILSESLRKLLPPDKEIYFACVGTDRSTGDSFGPLVGTYLKKAGVPNVIGTIHDPLHAQNLQDRLKEVPSDAFIVAIDSALGNPSSIGYISIAEKPLKPGIGVGKNLPPVGNVKITAIVNIGGFMEYFILQNTRLSLVMDMAEVAANAIKKYVSCCLNTAPITKQSWLLNKTIAAIYYWLGKEDVQNEPLSKDGGIAKSV